MNILNSTPTKEIRQAQISAEITSRLLQSKRNLILSHNSIMEMVWSHPALTPQEVCDGLGTAAASLFTIGGETSAYLAEISPESLPELTLPKMTFVLNQDGTVTISEQDYQG